MALLHHEGILPAWNVAAQSWGVWWIIACAYLAYGLHLLKHAYIRVRYGKQIDTQYKAPNHCESCQNRDEDLSLTERTIDELYVEAWLCDNCKIATAPLEVTR